jgi:hypothetical protein
MPDETSLVDRYLTTPVSALVAFVLAVLALMGQNALSVAGLALLVQVGLAVVLARRALADDAAAGWVPTLARAAVVLAALALVAGVLALIGTAVSNAAPGGF